MKAAATSSKQKLENGAVHRWYRFVLAYPDHYVRSQVRAFRLRPGDLVLDPFVGSGTTCVESKLLGLRSVGVDAHPFFVFATRVKTTWDVETREFQAERLDILENAKETIVGRTALEMHSKELTDMGDSLPYTELVTREYVSPLPFAKCLALESLVRKVKEDRVRDLFRLALATTFVASANVDFGPEIGLTKPKRDAEVLETFARRTAEMLQDLEKVAVSTYPEARVMEGDARELHGIEPNTVNGIITSPPYPVDKDYTRQIRLESAILGFVTSLEDSRKVKKQMIRASTRQIYSGDVDTELVRSVPDVADIIDEIKRRARRDGDTSGFVKQYPRLVGEYFGGMKRHFESAYPLVRRGGRAAYVVGDSRSFKMVHIETAKILGKIAKKAGFKVVGIELWRDRRSTAHTLPLPENALILQKP